MGDEPARQTAAVPTAGSSPHAQPPFTPVVLSLTATSESLLAGACGGLPDKAMKTVSTVKLSGACV